MLNNNEYKQAVALLRDFAENNGVIIFDNANEIAYVWWTVNKRNNQPDWCSLNEDVKAFWTQVASDALSELNNESFAE